MNKTTKLLGAAAAMALAFLAGSAYKPRTKPEMSPSAKVERGKYLVTIGGCNDCHTPWKMGAKGPEPDMSRTLSGHPQQFTIDKVATMGSDRWGIAMAPTNTAFSGPWGVSFAANLTPDRDTGIGIWTEDIFRNTIRNGRHWGVARPLNPPMPWFNYRHMTDEDLSAVFAYLRTLPAVHNEVPQPISPMDPVERGHMPPQEHDVN